MRTLPRGDVPDVFQQAMESSRGGPHPRPRKPSRKQLLRGLFGGLPEPYVDEILPELRRDGWRHRRDKPPTEDTLAADTLTAIEE